MIRSLGLNEYEEKIYLCLIKHGALSAKEIHKKTGVPQNRIYDCMVSLGNKSMIEIQPTEPKIFRAVEPKVVFGKIKQNTEIKEKKLQKLFDKQKVSEKEKQIWITQGYKAAVQARFKEFKTAKKEICAMVGKEKEITTARLTMVAREHRKALERGVSTRFLWNMEYPENIEKAKRVEPFGCKVKHFPVSGFSMVIIDGKIVRIELPDKQFERIVIWIENKKFAEAMQDYFEKCWKEGKDWRKLVKA